MTDEGEKASAVDDLPNEAPASLLETFSSRSRALGSSEQGAFDQLLIDGQPVWQPLVDEAEPARPTPQALAYDSAADLLLYGGAAGGGKTDLEIGLALTRHRRSIIYRRTFRQLAAIEERVAEILRSRKGYDRTAKVWKLPDGRRLEFGACRHAGDEAAYQGRPHDLKCFDEITHFLESQFRFLCGWLRSTRPGQRQRVVATGNPPTTGEGEWVIGFWAPWLDDQHPDPAPPGALRWYAVLGGEEKEVEGGAPFEWKGELIQPKSRSFIPSRVEDNPYLMKTGYRATLQALPEPLRSRLLKGAFDAGREADPWQVVPTDWIKAAQERWRAGAKPKGLAMTALGVDPARGGRDETVLSPRHGAWFAEQIVRPGAETPDGPAAAALVVAALRDGAPVAIDVIGIGAAVYDHLKGNGVAVAAMNGAEASHARDRSGSLGFVNRRAEWWWRLREALDPDYGQGLALPPDRRLLADLAAPRWRLMPRGIQVESKEEIMKRLGRSPDRGDAAVYAWAQAGPGRRRGPRHGRAQSAYDPHGW